MTDVKRYSSYNVMMSMEDQIYTPTADGKWVTYEDYTALQAEVTRLTKALDTAAIKAREKCEAKQYYSLGQACYDAIQHLKRNKVKNDG